MPLHQDFLKKQLDFLKTSDLFSSFPLSLLLIGLEALLDPHFSCPCRVLQNRLLTRFIFIGPAFFTFCLMFLYVRPFIHGWFHCPDPENDDTQKNWPKSLISCLIPPVMWIFLLFLDGDYFACGMTDWDGCYVFNKKMNMSWCHPYPKENMLCNTSSEDHGKMHLTLEYFHESQVIGYCVISVFSVLAVVLVGIYDCFVTGKCCCGRKLPDKVISVIEGESVTLTSGIKINKDDQIKWLFRVEKMMRLIAEIKRGTGEITASPNGRFRGRLKVDEKTGSLTITNIRPEVAGVYELKIRGGKCVQNFKKRFIVYVRGRQVNKSVLKGDSVTLNYDTEIQKDDKIQWKFGEKLIVNMTGENHGNPQWSDEFRDQMTLDPQSGSLTIQQTRPEHSGLYKLEIKTRDYSTFRLFRLIVCDEQKSVSVMKGADVTLCANPEIQTGDEIFWMFGHHNRLVAKNTKDKCEEVSEFSDDRFKDTVYLTDQTGDLTIKTIKPDHAGEYKLKIIRNGKSSFKLFNVFVYEQQVNKSVLKGRPVTLNYDTEIQEDDKMKWKFGPEEKLIVEMTGENHGNPQWSDEFRDQMTLDPQSGSLTIQQTRPEHSGLYKLEIKTRDYSTFKLFRLIVCDEEKSVPVMKGKDVTLLANPEIQSGDKIFWMFGDDNSPVAKNTEERCEEEIAYRESNFNAGFKGEVVLNRQTGDLTIKKIRTFHTGKYKLKIIRNGEASFKLFNVIVSDSTEKRKNESVTVEMNEEDPDGVNEQEGTSSL